MKLDLWFPTAVYSHDIPNAEKLNKSLIKHIKKWSKKDKGLKKTNRGGWHSTTDMHSKLEYEPLIQELMNVQDIICREEGYTADMYLGNMWANINYPGCFNKDHTHPNADWSGVYYVQTPKQCGTLEIFDPRYQANMLLPRQLSTKKIPPRLWRQKKYEPVAGRIIVFPAWLTHGVEINQSKEKGEKGWRVSVSFNFIQHQQIV